MSHVGQKLTCGPQTRLRYTPESGLTTDIVACPKGVKPRHYLAANSRRRYLHNFFF
jgi:hypothetical protein